MANIPTLEPEENFLNGVEDIINAPLTPDQELKLLALLQTYIDDNGK